jgi:AcrR family transcriptional regulator
MTPHPSSSPPPAPPDETDPCTRERIVAAAIRTIGAKGYRASSVADLAAAAGVSPAAFDEHFEDKEECFLAAHEQATERVLAASVSAGEPRRSWAERVHRGLAAIVDLFVADPCLARVAVVEVAAAGPAAAERQRAAVARLASLLEPGREPAGDRELPANLGEMSVGAAAGLISDELLAGGAARLPERLPDLVFTVLAPYVGPRAAAEEMRRAVAR